MQYLHHVTRTEYPNIIHMPGCQTWGCLIEITIDRHWKTGTPTGVYILCGFFIANVCSLVDSKGGLCMESVTPGLQDRVQQSKPEGNTLGCYPVQNTASRYVAPLSHFVRDQLITPVSVLYEPPWTSRHQDWPFIRFYLPLPLLTIPNKRKTSVNLKMTNVD